LLCGALNVFFLRYRLLPSCSPTNNADFFIWHRRGKPCCSSPFTADFHEEFLRERDLCPPLPWPSFFSSCEPSILFRAESRRRPPPHFFLSHSQQSPLHDHFALSSSRRFPPARISLLPQGHQAPPATNACKFIPGIFVFRIAHALLGMFPFWVSGP